VKHPVEKADRTSPNNQFHTTPTPGGTWPVGPGAADGVINERKADAQRVAEKALKERDDSAFREQLEKAKKGDVPPPWP
jgi:hypothetical protein